MLFEPPVFSAQPRQTPIRPDSLMTCFSKGRILLHHEGDTLSVPSYAQLSALLPEAFIPFELAHTDNGAVFMPHPFADLCIPEHDTLRYEDITIFRSLPNDTASLITASWHLWNWYLNNRFCGRCGHANEPDKKERALRCPHCGWVDYPKICPAIIVAITCGEKILLVRNTRSTFSRYALVAGYVEVGETLEQTVHREVLEEVGLRLNSLRYMGNRPWGFSGSHMFAFHATADDTQPIAIQESELTDARWFHRDELEPRDRIVSIAAELMERFRLGTL